MSNIVKAHQFLSQRWRTDLNGNRVLQDASKVIFDHLGQLLGAKTFFLSEVDGVSADILSAWNREDQLVSAGARVPYDLSYCKLVFDRNRSVQIEDTATDPLTRHLPATERLGACSMISAPVYDRDGRRFGALCAMDRPHAFPREALNYLEQAAMFLGVLVDVEESMYIDELTRVYNRSYLEMVYNHIAHENTVSTIFLDIDRCKEINDVYGRETGDQLLKELASRIQHTVEGFGVTARYAGDEFVVLLFHRDVDEVRSIAERIYKDATEPFAIAGHDVRITVSMGISVSGESLGDHIVRSDTAMFRIKKNGKQGIAVYEDDLQPLIPENGFRRSVKYNCFQVLYQPIVHFETGETKLEALIRMKHPELGVVGPDAFLPFAKQSGYLVEMDLQTIRTACEQVQRLADWPARVTSLAVNCDVLELRNAAFPDQIRRIMEETGFPAARLELELNEYISLFDVDAILPQMEKLRELGITFALDDFGHGYSTLGLIKMLPIRKVKLDRLFVDGIATDPKSQVIVEGLVGIGRKLGLTVVAEGVETEAQYAALKRLGCSWAQGYYFEKPLPLDEMNDWLGRFAVAERNFRG